MQKGLFKKAETVKSLADRNGVTTKFVNDLIHQGMKVESEHSTNSYIQRTIAIQHLSENLQYYKGLEKMEKSFTKKRRQGQPSFARGGDLNTKLAGTPAGGAIEKIENGKTEITSDGTEGGIFKGQRHSESNGGIDGIVDGSGQVKVENEEALIIPESVNKQGTVTFNGRQMTNKQVLSEINTSAGGVPIKQSGGPVYKSGGPVTDEDTGDAIQLKGSSVVITRDAVLSDKKTEFNGQMLTNRQILSQINQSGGGAAFEEGGNLPQQISCSMNQYSYGGKMMHAEEIATDMNNTCGCKHSMETGGSVKVGEDDFKNNKAMVVKSFLSFSKCPNYVGIYDENDNESIQLDWGKYGYTVAEERQSEDFTQISQAAFAFNNHWDGRFIALTEHGDKFNSVRILGAANLIKSEQYINELNNKKNGLDLLRRVQKITGHKFSPVYNYVFKKHSESNPDLLTNRGFGETFDTEKQLKEICKRFLPRLNFKEVSQKLKNITDFPTNEFNGWNKSRPILISSPGEGGNDSGYYFSVYKLKKKGVSFEVGGEINNENSKETVLAEIATINLPDLFKIAFKGQPWRIMKYIQEQATGMSGENNGVGENSYDNIVRMVGSEDLVKKCISLLSNPKKRKISHFIENSNHPAPAGLIEALEIKKNFETGGTVAGSGQKIVRELKKEFIFIASLKAALDNGTSTSGWDINLFKSSFYNALAKLHKTGKTENLKEIFDFIRETEKNMKLTGPVFTDAHKIWKLKPADVPAGEPEQESKQYPVDKPMRSSDIPALVKQFMPQSQQKAVVGNTELWEVIDRIYSILQKMPHTYQTEKLDTDDKIVYLHYFYGGSDWYIVEKDKGNGPDDQLQTQAFGYTILNGDHEMAEWGYINIEELKSFVTKTSWSAGIELDFYFTPVKFGQLKKKWERNDEPEEEKPRFVPKPGTFSYGVDFGVPESYSTELLTLLSQRGFVIKNKNGQSVDLFKNGHDFYVNDNGGELNLGDRETAEHICDIAYVGSHPKEWVATPEQLAAKIEMYFDEYYNINNIKGTEENKPAFVPRPGTFSYGVDFGVPENDSQLLLVKLREQGFAIIKKNGSSVVILKSSMPKMLVNDNGGEFNIKEVDGNAHITNEPYDTTTGIIPPAELAVNISNIYDEHFKSINNEPNPFKDRYFGDVIINPLREINDQFELFNELSSITIGYKGYTFNVQDNRRLKSNPDNSYSVFYATKENDYDQIAKIDEGDYGSLTELARLIEAHILTFVDKKEREKTAPVSQQPGKIVLSNTMKTIDLDENGKSIMEEDDDDDDDVDPDYNSETDYDPVLGKALKNKWEKNAATLSADYGITSYTFNGYELYLKFSEGSEGSLDLADRAYPQNYSPNRYDSLKEIQEFLLSDEDTATINVGQRMIPAVYEEVLKKAGELSFDDFNHWYAKTFLFQQGNAGAAKDTLKMLGLTIDDDILKVYNEARKQVVKQALLPNIETNPLKKYASKQQFMNRAADDVDIFNSYPVEITDNLKIVAEYKGNEFTMTKPTREKAKYYAGIVWDAFESGKLPLHQITEQPMSDKPGYVNYEKEPSHITDHNPTPQEVAADPDSFSAAEKTGTENLIQMYQGKKQSVINDAIRALLKKKGAERKLYSADEIAFLKLYEGAGGLAKQGETGARLFDQFFTPVEICGKMWGFALKYGFKFEGANILEPSVGSGRILQFIPPNSGADVVAYDVDETCYLLCKVLFPDFDIRHGSFEEMFFKGNRHIGLAGVTDFFDLVITNPPYREYISEWNKLGEGKATGATTFEMYFIARGVDVLKPGGLLIMLIPNTFLSNDNKYNDFKNKLAQKVDFLDAYRFPNGVFGNTDVGTDLIVLRKK